jgi:hypothetical protein
VLTATGASKTRAYELRAAIMAMLPALLRPPGRPSAPMAPQVDTGAISRKIIHFLMDHLGAVTTSAARRRYSDGFRHHVMELAEQHAEIEVGALAEAVGVPAPTVQDWLAAPAAPAIPSTDEADQADIDPDPTGPRIGSILEAWRRWEGRFAPFCTYVREHLEIPYGHTLIGRILAVHAGRRPKRRGGRSPDEKATRGALQTFFAGGQWIGDGSPIGITFNGEKFTYNWELIVDAHTGAFVGCSVRPEEDGRGVVEAFEDGVATTGAPPIALSTDNRAPNHAPEVHDALGDTLHIRATRGRPQNDAPVEGGFGLFRQTSPPLVIEGATPEELVRCALALMLTIWARATNHRPRNDRRGRTRVQLYRDEQPTDEQIAAAKAALEERRRRQELAFETRRARLDPVVRALLDEVFARLGLEDPTGNIRDAIARHPHDAVLAGIATFEGKRAAGTLKLDVGARYLLGIVFNIASRDEGLAIAEAHWNLRKAARDVAFLRLEDERRAVTGTPTERLRASVDRALATESALRRAFWLRATSDIILEQPEHQHAGLHRIFARRVHGTFRVHPHERQAAVRVVTNQVLPIA